MAITAEALMTAPTPEMRADPYPAYRALRERGRVAHFDDSNLWFVSGFAEAAAVLRHPASSVDPTSGEITGWLGDSPMAPMIEALLSKVMLFVDAPDHTRLRSLVASAFTPSVVEGLRPRVRQLAD